MQATTETNEKRGQWALALLWINLSVIVVVVVQIIGSQVSSLRQVLHVLVYGLVYANLTGILGTWLLSGLVEKLASARKLPMLALVGAGVFILTPLGCLLAQSLLAVIGFVVPAHFWGEYFATLRIALPLAAVFGLGAAVHASLQGRMQQMKAEILEREIAEERALKLASDARLRSLESRIHPHFLFNTLNSISSLIAVDPARAEQIVGRLATLLRVSLDTSHRPLIPLREELAMVESYLDIERVRFGDKLRASIEVPAELQDTNVPPMSVQSLVENAVKHGITPQAAGGECRVTACADGNSLCIAVLDSGAGFDLTQVPAGHGLDSLVERLDALFRATAHLNVSRKDGYSVVEMVLPRQ